MEQLNKIIEKMAFDNFNADSGKNPDARMEFILNNATLNEYFNFFNNNETYDGRSLLKVYGDTTLALSGMGGIGERFIKAVLWPKLKNKYFEAVVSSLEQKVSPTLKVTFEL